MASVKELKDLLEAERGEALKAAELAISAISTQLSFAQWVLGILSILIGILALVGFGFIYRASKTVANGVAQKAMKSYLEGSEVQKLITRHVEQAVEVRVRSLLIINSAGATRATPDDQPPFPNQPTG